MAEEIDDLTRALGEAHVELRALERGRTGRDGVSLSSSSCASSTTCRSGGFARSSACPFARTTTAALATALATKRAVHGERRRVTVSAPA